MKQITIAAAAALMLLTGASAQAADEPLVLARDGFMYVGGNVMTVEGREYYYGQMYVEMKIPANQTHPYPVIMVHGGSMSGTNFPGTPDGREGWAQYFVRQGYAVYIVDQPGRGRSGFLTAATGPMRSSERGNSASRFVAQEKFKLWPQASLHTAESSRELFDHLWQDFKEVTLPEVSGQKQEIGPYRNAIGYAASLLESGIPLAQASGGFLQLLGPLQIQRRLPVRQCFANL